MSAPRIFISAPTSRGLREPWRTKLRAAVVEEICKAGFEPQMFGATGIPTNYGWNFDQVEEVLDHCHGAIVIALARHHYKVKTKEIKFATEYNHYEGAAAISHGIPVLILAEAGVEPRGIVNPGGGRFIVEIPENAKPGWLATPTFRKQFDTWKKLVSDQHDVFFGYCSKAKSTAAAIKNFLRDNLGLKVNDWAVDFKAGGSILTRIQDSARTAKTGLFLFTRDDEIQGKKNKAAPRDNVIFEAGFFVKAKGQEHVLIIREKGAKMPADLGGNIYIDLKKRDDTSTIEEQLRKFFTAVL